MSDPYQGRVFRETERRAFGAEDDSYKDYGRPESDSAQVMESLDKDLVQFRGCVDSIGTNFDNHDNRKELKRLRSQIKKKITSAEVNLQGQKGRVRGPEKIQFDRRSKQLDSHVKLFHNLLQTEKTTTHKHPTVRVPTEGGDDVTDRDEVAQAQTQTQFSALRQREEEAEDLVELERDITDLHDIQKELATLVGEQGEKVDLIDQNVGHAQTRVEHGVKQLDKALVLKRSARRKQVVICCIVSTIVIVILIAIAILIAVLVTQVD